MKRKMILFLLCCAMVLTLPVQAALMGEQIDSYTAPLARGLTLTENRFWTGSDYRSEHYMTLSPGGVAAPVVVSGETLWAGRSVTDAARSLEQTGFRALAGVNGGFYTMATGEPVGLVASDGVLRADDQYLWGLGFRADGSAVLGRPETRLSLCADGGEVLPIASLNHAVGAGAQLYTPDCVSAVKLPAKYRYAVCVYDALPGFDREIALRVEYLGEAEDSLTVPEDRLLLTLAAEENEAEQSFPAAIDQGAALTLKCACAPGWEDVTSAVGILYPLVEEGRLLDIPATSAGPRTAVGLKADGSIVFYTVDGRQSGHSVGAALSGAAKRLLELGCVSAGALDGGGSTLLAAGLPGGDGLTIVNKPSEGTPRRVVNYIFLQAPDEPAGSADGLALYPLHINAVAGTRVPLTVKAIDKNGKSAAVPGRLSYTVTGGLGRVRDGVFYAEGSGSGSITVSAPGVAAATVPLHVAAEPDSLALYGEKYGRLTQSLTLESGQAVDLTVRAMDKHVELLGEDTLYTWTLDPLVGAVDETGHLVPGENSGQGMLTVSLGKSNVAIPITIRGALPFWDVHREDACYEAVRYVYEHDIFAGTGDTTFDPGVVMNRAMLVTVLWRMCGRPEAAAPAPFLDVPAEEWYGPAVAWAAETGLVEGYSETAFGPLDDLTREQILTILHRWAGLPEAGETETDLSDASDYAVPALAWALERELVVPDEALGLQPRGPMDRAAVADALMRYELNVAER